MKQLLVFCLFAVLVQIDKKLVEKGALLHRDCELEEIPE